MSMPAIIGSSTASDDSYGADVPTERNSVSAHARVTAGRAPRANIDKSLRGQRMSENKKQTSKKVAHLAAETLHDPKASTVKKSLAASALSQSHSKRQTGAAMEHKASEVLHSNKYSAETKTLAASVLAQSGKERKPK
ncbi:MULTISPECIES: hypothetical protein [unclassified Caballeronia]|uniref:hypothetical protein n=1 Tax=unclassified Caballeronia TaxID=2646786 RepID=UPI0020298260|nr:MULTISPECIES: hypothetical protein [unclassified Caballeronia]